MSRRKPQAKPQILGPDGKPYVAPPKPRESDTKPEPRSRATDDPLGDVASYFTTSEYIRALMSQQSIFGQFTSSYFNTKKPPSRRPLREAVEAQILELTESFGGHGGEELPTPPADLTTYADAFASARKNCPHANYEDVVYAKREAYCTDCRQFFKRPRGLWG